MNLRVLQDVPEVLAAVLFGSTARRDDDAYSDKDVFILCEDIELPAIADLKKNAICPGLGQEDGVSCYPKSVVHIMANKGSLFLWHLRLEGVMLFSKNGAIEEIYERLRPYNRYAEDLASYEELLQDVTDSLTHHGQISEFDLSLLFTIARNTCILLCYRAGIPKFGRSNAYLCARKTFGAEFPLPDWVYPELCAWKLWYERGREPHRRPNGGPRVGPIVGCVARLMQFARGKCL